MISNSLRSQALEPPVAPTPAIQATMQTMHIHRQSKPPAPSSWMKAMARARDVLPGCVVALHQVDAEVCFFMFLFAKENPYLLWFLPLIVQSTASLKVVPDDVRKGDVTPPPLWKFLADPFDIKTHSDLPDVDKEKVFLLPQVGLCQADPLLFQSWLDFMPVGFVLKDDALKNKKAEREVPVDEKFACTDFEAALADHPWLERYLSKPVIGGGSGSSGGASASSHQDRVTVADAELDDATVEGIFSELEKKRAEWRLDARPGLEQFRYTLQGGQWTMANGESPRLWQRCC